MASATIYLLSSVALRSTEALINYPPPRPTFSETAKPDACAPDRRRLLSRPLRWQCGVAMQATRWDKDGRDQMMVVGRDSERSARTEQKGQLPTASGWRQISRQELENLTMIFLSACLGNGIPHSPPRPSKRSATTSRE